ncbi:MAG TPA: DmsC/YnfH family molybdoenzyme membrane anchor subunit [Verrucomicrobium sp.]|nr:DmsC/YnfH family molybdoenzyme membrane anchor subunit [Verrucomicrobium sp.]
MSTLEHRTSLIDQLLSEQQELGTAVSRFAEWHEEEGRDGPSQARYYKNLIPLSKPIKGEQYAFEVNLDQCTGCKACVAACHSMNGLDDRESWRDMGALAGCRDEPYFQTVTTACHHCADPACANGCPVLAYEKDPVTGIVRHLDDQCIGCSYCILKCPYDVPKYNPKRGIVRKCDMCQQRLEVGEAPACVQSCPSGAIAIRIVKTETVTMTALQPGERLLPGAFESAYTQPTTRYVSSHPIPETARPQHAGDLHLEESHAPLAWMLVLTQMAAGLALAAALSYNQPKIMLAVTLAAVGALAVGLGVSVLHLGQPLRAWRAFLGWRKSWLSREILAFGGFFKIGAVACWFNHPALTALFAATGLASVFCSCMVYIDTRRQVWGWVQTSTKFFGTTLLLGAAGAAAVTGWLPTSFGTVTTAAALFSVIAVLVRGGLFAFEGASHIQAMRDAHHPRHRSAMTLSALAGPALQARLFLFIGALILSLLAMINMAGLVGVWATLSLLCNFASQVIERHLYFAGASAPRMPGVPAAPHHHS